MTKKIIACVNGYDPSETVCDYAGWVAHQTKTAIKLVHTLDQQVEQIVEKTADLTGNLSLGERDELLDELVEVEHEQKKLMLRRGKIVLEKSKRHIEKNGPLEIEKTLLHGRLQPNLIEMKEQISLLIIGRYGQAHFEQNATGVGHKVEGVIRSLETPILVVVKPFVEPKKVMIAYDASAGSQKTISYVASSQLFTHSTIHLVHVGKMDESFTALWQQAQKDLQSCCEKLEVTNLEGQTSQALTQYQADQKIDLTIMGAFGHHWLRSFLIGSTTSEMLSQSKGALLLVR